MAFKIKNWKLSLLALLLTCLFTGLGLWQVSRAHQKSLLIKSFAARTQQTPLTPQTLKQINDWRFYRVNLEGSFDNQHTFLLDNKIFHGKVGYEVYTPFIAKDLSMSILVDRGFIPIGAGRKNLPAIHSMIGTFKIIGMLNVPPSYAALGPISDNATITWPLRIEFVNLPQIANLLHFPLYPYVLSLDPHDPSAYAVEWEAVVMSPERHMAYAVQWFALALTLLILFFGLNRTAATTSKKTTK